MKLTALAVAIVLAALTGPPLSAQPAQPSRVSAENLDYSRELPVGTEVDVRLLHPVSAGGATIPGTVKARTVVPLYKGSRLLIPAGAVLSGPVAALERPRVEGDPARLTVTFSQLQVGTRLYWVEVALAEVLDCASGSNAGHYPAHVADGEVKGGTIATASCRPTTAVESDGAIVWHEGETPTLPAGTVLRLRFSGVVVID